MTRIRNLIFWVVLIILNTFITTTYAQQIIKTPNPISGRNPNNTRHIIPADVLARAKLFSKELNLIRQALGKPSEKQNFISVSNASPREVYFEAEALFQKTNQLAYEITGGSESAPRNRSNDIVPADVYSVVDASLKRILLVKKELGITKKIIETKEASNTTPSDVFNSILNSNQELSGLLYQKISPTDVYSQITQAISYSAHLINQANASPLIPNPSQFSANKKPSDVYKRLIKCIQTLQVIAEKSNIRMLHIKVNDFSQYQATASNAYDISKIIVAETKYLNMLLPKPEEVDLFYPGYKTPSQTFQRSSILLKQLNILKKSAEKNSSWLADPDTEAQQ